MSCTGAQGGCTSDNRRSAKLQTTEIHTTVSFSPSTQEPERSLDWRSIHNLVSQLENKLTFSPSRMSAHWQVWLFSENASGEQLHRHLITLFQWYILQTLSVYLQLNVNAEFLHKWHSQFGTEDLHSLQKHWHSTLDIHFAWQRQTFIRISKGNITKLWTSTRKGISLLDKKHSTVCSMPYSRKPYLILNNALFCKKGILT